MIRTDSEFLQLALTKYDNPHLVSLDEFSADIKRFIYINTLLSRYKLCPDKFKDRLIINHIVILGNCFGVNTTLKMLEYKIRKEYIIELNTILYYLEWIDSAEKLNFELLAKLKLYDNQ